MKALNKKNHALLLAGLLSLMSMTAAAMQEMSDIDLEANSGQGLIVADKLPGLPGSNHTFYRMMLNAEVGLNNTIDKLQLGCGGFNDAVVAAACDIDIDYLTLMGRGGGQPGAPGAGAPATSEARLIRPYIELAIKNDDDPTRRQIIGFKLGAGAVDGYMGTGRYTAPGSPGASPNCTNATSGAGAFYCHQGINRLSGFQNINMIGEAFGCFGVFGCTPAANPASQYRVATFSGNVQLWGTRMNRIQARLDATTDPAATLGLSLTAPSRVNQSLRFVHGLLLDEADPRFAADDFFISFQREAIRYPTYNKTNTHSNFANPGWWMNVPAITLTGLKAYGVAASLGSLGGITLTDPDISQRPPDNCFGGLKFC